MLLEVLEARQRVLGPDHPDTLKTAAALKGIWYDALLTASGDLTASDEPCSELGAGIIRPSGQSTPCGRAPAQECG